MKVRMSETAFVGANGNGVEMALDLQFSNGKDFVPDIVRQARALAHMVAEAMKDPPEHTPLMLVDALHGIGALLSVAEASGEINDPRPKTAD